MRFSRALKIFLALFLWVLVGCSKHSGGVAPIGPSGNGEAYQGGNLLLSYLQSTRGMLFQTLSYLKSSPDSSVCQVDDPTGKDPVLFQIANAMTPAQRDYCLSFVQGTLVTLPDLYSTADPGSLALTYNPIYIDQAGLLLRVVATTQLQTGTQIVFDATLLPSYSTAQVEAALTQQYASKLSFPTYGGPVSDDAPAGPFTGSQGGYDFLNAVGSAVALYEIPITQTSLSQVFTQSASFMAPAGVSQVIVEIWGGGGGGGGAQQISSSQHPASSAGGGGGAGGGYCRAMMTVTPGASYTITVGQGGAGGSAGMNGSEGATTSFDTLASATGGKGGTAPILSANGAVVTGHPGLGGDCSLSSGPQVEAISGTLGGDGDFDSTSLFGAKGGIGGIAGSGQSQVGPGTGSTGGSADANAGFGAQTGTAGQVTVWWDP